MALARGSLAGHRPVDRWSLAGRLLHQAHQEKARQEHPAPPKRGPAHCNDSRTLGVLACNPLLSLPVSSPLAHAALLSPQLLQPTSRERANLNLGLSVRAGVEDFGSASPPTARLGSRQKKPIIVITVSLSGVQEVSISPLCFWCRGPLLECVGSERCLGEVPVVGRMLRYMYHSETEHAHRW